MSKPKWTPGPWRASVEEPPFRIGDCLQGQQIWGRCRIAFTERQNVGAAQEAANAHLIAAAPDLYEALLVAETFVAAELETRESSLLPDPGPEEAEYITDARMTLNAIRAALTKARGEIS